jgi:hypothetical protein
MQMAHLPYELGSIVELPSEFCLLVMCHYHIVLTMLLYSRFHVGHVLPFSKIFSGNSDILTNMHEKHVYFKPQKVLL